MRTTVFLTAFLLAGAYLGIGSVAQPPPQDQPTRPVGKTEPRAAEARAAERPEDARAIAALGEQFIRAYNEGDSRAIAALFTDDAEVTDEAGATVRGREAIAELFAAAFEADPKATIELAAESLRFPGPDVAREVGRARTTPADGGPPESTRYTVLYVRRDGRWLHDSVQEQPDRAPTPHERLKELEWLVGEWIDEGDDGVVHTTCRWSEDGNFLLRDFTLRIAGRPIAAGSQRIGWDTRAGQFQSWVFDADGGHSEGLWSRAARDEWVIRAAGVLADGRAVSATQFLSRGTGGLARWRSVDRTVGGQAVPDVDEIVLVRIPPRPAALPKPAPNVPRKP